MVKVVCSVQDIKADYGDPFVSDNVFVACRVFESTVKHSGSLLHEYPEDFRLIQIGEYDTHTGELTAFPVVDFVVLMNGTDVIQSKE